LFFALRTCLIEERKLGVAVHIQKLNRIPSVGNTRIFAFVKSKNKKSGVAVHIRKLNRIPSACNTRIFAFVESKNKKFGVAVHVQKFNRIPSACKHSLRFHSHNFRPIFCLLSLKCQTKNYVLSHLEIEAATEFAHNVQSICEGMAFYVPLASLLSCS
jgi:hypothetical protein